MEGEGRGGGRWGVELAAAFWVEEGFGGGGWGCWWLVNVVGGGQRGRGARLFLHFIGSSSLGVGGEKGFVKVG